MGRGLEIDFETADRITLCCLMDQLNYLEREVAEHIGEGKYMHPDDYTLSTTKLIPALKVVIDYFGGPVV